MSWNQFIELEQVSPQEQEDLLNELYKQMFIVAYSKMQNKMDALDVVQESWLKILQKIDGLKDRQKLFRWAKVIVSNTANNVLRRKKILEIIPLCDLAEKLSSNETFVGVDELEEQVLRKTINECLDQLDLITRKILIYKYFYGLTLHEIAEITAMPEGTVKSRIHRAKCRLKIMLEEDRQIHINSEFVLY